jgi:hypothetical protein
VSGDECAVDADDNEYISGWDFSASIALNVLLALAATAALN